MSQLGRGEIPTAALLLADQQWWSDVTVQQLADVGVVCHLEYWAQLGDNALSPVITM
jgi:hypothetical protein